MFKIADSASNRHIVQIFTEDGMKILATILALPDQRLEPADKPIVMFAETPEAAPPAVKAWFYPGRTIGHEFVYPRVQAMAIAKSTHEKVLATESTATSAEEMKTAQVTRIDETGEEVAVARTEERAAVGTAGQPPAPTREAPAELPKTASSLPLLALMGLFSLGGAVVARAVAKSIG